MATQKITIPINVTPKHKSSYGRGELRRHLRKGKSGKLISKIEVGFFATARYANGTPVTNVAAWNEFGTVRGGVTIPERPFFRQANKKMPKIVMPILRAHVNPATLTVTRRTAELMGIKMGDTLADSIRSLRHPPNAPTTIKLKGSSNPLIDTGLMLRSVTHKVSI